MAFIQQDVNRQPKFRIDLQGPDGNAFVLLSIANKLAKSLCWEQEDINSMLKEMKAGDYEHLLITLNKHLGEYLDLVLPHNFSWSEKSPTPSSDAQSSDRVVWSPSPTSAKLK